MKEFRSFIILVVVLLSFIISGVALSQPEGSEEKSQMLSLITNTPEEGFQVAIQLARKGVTEKQPDKKILFMLRDVY